MNVRFKNFQWVYGGIRCAGCNPLSALYGAAWELVELNPVDLRAEDAARWKRWAEGFKAPVKRRKKSKVKYV